MSDKSREEEKLSFKEQILRDLEQAKTDEKTDEKTSGEINELFSTLMNPSDLDSAKKQFENSAQELIADSVSTVDQLIANAPTVPPRPSNLKEDIEESNKVSETTNTSQMIKPNDGESTSSPTKVQVSYRTQGGKSSVPKPKKEVKIETKSQEVPVKVNFKPTTKATEITGTTETTETTELPKRRRRESEKPAKKKKKSHVKGFFVTLLVLIVLLGAGGYFGLQYAESALQPVDPNSKQYVSVQIPDGANIQEIASTLENSGLIKNSLIFTLYVKYKNYSEFKSGHYNLQKSMSTDDLIKELQKGGTPEPQEVTHASLTIPEGYTLEQIAQTVGQLQGDFKEALTAEAFMTKVQDEAFIAQAVAKYPTLLESLPAKDSGVRYRLEGYLFPATYAIKESTTVESLIDEMLAAMDKNLSAHYATIKEKNLTVNELLTIASLVDKEGAKTEDRKLIAGVFYNRLNIGMPLQSNIAILYAEGKLGQNISLADDVAIDTAIDSPYNVYTNLGLMPGPVDSPSLDAIESSINQTKSENLYFVANVQDGKVYFAATQEEHDRNVEEHINSKLKQSNNSN